MPSTCCVPGCFNLGGFSFPKDYEIRQVWITRVCRENPGKRKWVPSPSDRVCELHFNPEDIVMNLASNSDRVWRALRPGAVPKKPKEKEKDTSLDDARRERLKRRNRIQEQEFVNKSCKKETELPESLRRLLPMEANSSANRDPLSSSGSCSKTGFSSKMYEKNESRDTNIHDKNSESDMDATSTGHSWIADKSDSNIQDVLISESELPEVVLEVDLEDAKVADYDGENIDSDPENTDDDKDKDDETEGIQHPTLSFGRFSLESLISLPGGFRYYTSFEDKEHFDYVFNCLGPGAYHLKYHSKLNPREEFLLLMIKLRQNKDDIELSWMFGVSQSTVGKIFKTWLNFVYFQLRELNIWSSREVVDTHMPSDFKKKFPKTRVILDGSEIPIEKPSNPKEQSATWSAYKNHNTLKILVGISPRGDVTYISDVYGGAASDRAIVERSDLLREGKFDKEDSVMADRGFVVHDLFCLQQVHVNIPTVMRNMVQIPPDKVIRDRRIASKRVHIERIIGLAKTYKILKDDLHHCHVPLGGRILYVCFALVNFRPSIVDNDA